MRFFFCFFLLPFISHSKDISTKPAHIFLENVGQVTDQYYASRNDIGFCVHAANMTMYIGNGQIHYQFYAPATGGAIKNETDTASAPVTVFNTYRLDVSLVNANTKGAIISVEDQSRSEYYHTAAVQGKVRAFTKITYKDVYPNIDWVLYTIGGDIKYDFIVRDGGNPADIRLKYDGASSLYINSDGSLTAVTPLGDITEHAPYAYQANGKKVGSSFKAVGDHVSFITDAYTGTLIIDPELEWSTYYGNGFDKASATITDKYGNVYLAGETGSMINIATTGAHQQTHGGWGDAYLIKFDSSGTRLWGTYYGGTEADNAKAIVTDSNSNIYVAGYTKSTNAIATPGSYQETFAGGINEGDAFLAKFDSAGVLQWGTYYGGAYDDKGLSLAVDKAGHVYISGATKSLTNIATAGAHQPTHHTDDDAFLAKFTSAGTRIWGTYYGGGGLEYAAVAVDTAGNVYLGGTNGSSLENIATLGSHQSNAAGGLEAMLIKFNSYGIRQWGTYYGSSGYDVINAIATDEAGYIYVAGKTNSMVNIATQNSYQENKSQGMDGFLVKFDKLGVRQWGTYYGGSGDDEVNAIAVDRVGRIYVAGTTTSGSGIATVDGYLAVPAGGKDAFWAVLDNTGTRLWGTYFGGASTDEAMSIAAYDSTDIYIAGFTGSTGIATTNGHQTTFNTAGIRTGFLARFSKNDVTGIYSLTHPQNAFTLHPNPGDGIFNFSGILNSTHNNVNLHVTDVLGKLVYSRDFGTTKGTINCQMDLENLPSQMYILKVTTGSDVQTIPFIKQ